MGAEDCSTGRSTVDLRPRRVVQQSKYLHKVTRKGVESDYDKGNYETILKKMQGRLDAALLTTTHINSGIGSADRGRKMKPLLKKVRSRLRQYIKLLKEIHAEKKTVTGSESASLTPSS